VDHIFTLRSVKYVSDEINRPVVHEKLWTERASQMCNYLPRPPVASRVPSGCTERE
jgi:hypothetical protein